MHVCNNYKKVYLNIFRMPLTTKWRRSILYKTFEDKKGLIKRRNSKDREYNVQQRVRIVVFNAIFNNISVISWWSVLLVKETDVAGEHHMTKRKETTIQIMDHKTLQRKLKIEQNEPHKNTGVNSGVPFALFEYIHRPFK